MSKEKSTLDILEEDIRQRVKNHSNLCHHAHDEYWVDTEHLEDMETFIEIVDNLRKYNQELLEENISLKQQMILDRVQMTDRLTRSLETLKSNGYDDEYLTFIKKVWGF